MTESERSLPALVDRNERLGERAEGRGEPVSHEASGRDAEPIRARKLLREVTLDRLRRRGDLF